MSLDYNRKLIPRAKELRKNMTVQERRLWYDFLRNLPIRFQRQKTIDHFIVDFYCHQAKLVIEIDGSQHNSESGLAYDAERTAVLEGLGLTVIRFPNHDVDHNFETVCKTISRTLDLRLPSWPPPRGGCQR